MHGTVVNYFLFRVLNFYLFFLCDGSRSERIYLLCMYVWVDGCHFTKMKIGAIVIQFLNNQKTQYKQKFIQEHKTGGKKKRKWNVNYGYIKKQKQILKKIENFFFLSYPNR